MSCLEQAPIGRNGILDCSRERVLGCEPVVRHDNDGMETQGQARAKGLIGAPGSKVVENQAQADIFPDLANPSFEDNANEAIHRFIAQIAIVPPVPRPNYLHRQSRGVEVECAR